jgi:hypothetical protein
VDEATAKSFWTAAGSGAPRRFGCSIRSRKAVSPLRSATAVQNYRNWSLIGFSELNFTSDLCAFASLRLCVKTSAESDQNGSLPFFRHPAYFNPMTRKATGLLPGLRQTAVWLNTFWASRRRRQF